MQNAGQQSKTMLPFYYGWAILAASAISEMMVIGATSYSAGLFVLPLQAELGLSRADASSGVLILFLGGMVIAPFVGRILDNYPLRRVLCLGIFAMCLALVVISQTSSLLLMALMLLLPAALGFMILGTLTSATLVSRWFYRRRGLALGIAAIATSGGGFTVVPLMSAAIQHFGWRSALLYEAAVFAVIELALTFLIMRDRPDDVGLAQNPEMRGRPAPSLLAAPHAGSALVREFRHWKDAFGNYDFWAPTLSLAAISGIAQGIVVSAVPYGVQLGLKAGGAALLISAFSIAAGLTKLIAGIIADLVDQRAVLFLSAVSMMLSLALLSWLPTPSSLLAACCLAGIALGGSLPVSAGLIAARFGAARFGGIMGWSYVLLGALTILATRVAGTLFDRTGSYHAAFLTFLVFCGVVFVIGAGTELARTKRG